MHTPEHDPARPDDHGTVHGPKKFQWTPRAIATVVGLVVGVLFILSNRHTAPIEFLWWEQELPVWVGLLVASLLGLVVGGGFGYRRGKDTGTVQALRTKKK
ncbi:MAG: hypothetical protein ACKO04_00620 [Actinomycetes bacterium]